LSAAPTFKFSKHFPGIIWNTLVVPDKNLLILEIRDDKNFQVCFSALNFLSGKFIWENVKLKETWWIGFTAANNELILFHTYIQKGNPDHKNLIAYDIFSQKIRWEVEEFSFFDWDHERVYGYLTKDELLHATINISNGMVAPQQWAVSHAPVENTAKPVMYLEGSAYFETLKEFVEQKTQHTIKKGVEYLEWNEWILMSLYREENGKLANYLLVFSRDGVLLMDEKLGENLSGLGTDTFFILAGCLILVKNRTELVVYTYG
jgi:hypothetical protein